MPGRCVAYTDWLASSCGMAWTAVPHHSCMVEECCDALKLPPAAVWVRPACSVISGRQTRAPGLPPAAPRNTVGALHTLSLCQAVSPLWGVPGKPPAVLSPKSAAPHPGADASGSTVPPTSQVTSLENTICSDPKTAAKAFLQALSVGGAQARSAVYALVNAVGGRAAGQVACPALAAGSPVKHALCRGSAARSRPALRQAARRLLHMDTPHLVALPTQALDPALWKSALRPPPCRTALPPPARAHPAVVPLRGPPQAVVPLAVVPLGAAPPVVAPPAAVTPWTRPTR